MEISTGDIKTNDLPYVMRKVLGIIILRMQLKYECMKQKDLIHQQKRKESLQRSLLTG